MSGSSDHNRDAYPTANIVVGVGRVGLAALEQIGGEWSELSVASDDPTLKNLRLVHVRPDDDGRGRRWREQEREYVRLAKYTGDDDRPSRALDFVILRSLGIVRFHDGAYQVAIPRDEGVVERDGGEPVARRRYFEWKHLSPDPIGAAERLAKADDDIPDLERFAEPLLNRVKLGHSPQAVLASISRCRALSEGRDPSPWRWICDEIRCADLESGTNGFRRVSFDPDWLEPGDRQGVLENFAQAPVRGWEEWFRSHVSTVGDGVDGVEPELSIPDLFVPRPSDLEAPLEPLELLKGDWEKSGWATDSQTNGQRVQFRPAEVSEFRLGLFDHDDSSEVHRTRSDDFAERLRELSVHAHRGLVRLWVDLQRNRVESPDHTEPERRRRGESSESLRQTLELLGELVVRPIVGDDEEGGDDLDELQWAERDEDWIESGDFPLEPTRQLDEATVDRAPADNEAARALWDRFEELGFSPDTDPLPERPLFRQVSWTPEDARTDGEADTTMGDHDAEDRRRPGALEFRSVLNEEARHLFHFDRLREVREGTTGRPPRLNIYVVADMGEPFARTVTRTVLREIHAELLRAYGPLFESYREGFDRTLAIHPILWTPHPADAFGGRYPVENRCEEAAIIESIQGIRRWVESVPRGTRCIPQVFVNSRVTDNAVLGRRDAVEETVDFLSFQMRNRLGEDPWLRRAASGSPGTDLFATFSCREIEFPAIEAREYLANRLARMSLAELDAGDPGESPSLDREAIEAPDAAELEGEGRDRIRQRTRQEAEDCEDRVQQRLDIGFDTTTAEIEGAFDESYEATLVRRIHDRWRSITRDRGLMDEVVDDLRTRSTKELGELLEEIREVGDRLVEEYASEGDLGAAKAGFNELTRWSGDELREAERQRREGERECLENSEPTMDAVESARRAVAAAAPDKPRGSAMRTAELAWLLMCPAMGAPISWAVALYTGMPSSPGPLEFVFGPLGYLVGGLVLYALGRYLMRRHMANRIEEIQSAIDRLAESAGEVVDGSGASVGGRTSIRSFVEARLGYAGRLAARNYARRVYERVARDDQLAQRIYRSIDVQREHLLRRAEALGVRVEMGDGAEGEDEEDLSELFGGRGERGRPSLLDPEILDEYFRSRTGGRFSVRRSLPTFIDRAGGFDNWRRTAVLSDTDRLMDYGRERFSELVDRPVADQMAFGERAGDRIVEFARDVYPNLGFAAKFSGYEGMDPDGIDIVADSALVLNPKLRGVFERARQRNDVEAETETLDVIEAGVDPNAAYMLSLASGLRPHSIQNLLRHESYTDRGDMPDDRTFPLSGEPPGSESPSPINHLTGHDELRDSINEPILREFQRGRAQLGAVPSGVRAAREAASRSAEEIDGKEGEGESAAEEGGNDGTADTSEASGDGAASELDRSVSDDDAAEGTDRAGTDEETPGADARDGESTDAADGPGGDETGADAGRTVDRGESNLGGADTDGTPIGKIDLKPPPSLGESSQDGDESAQEREGGGESESDPGETTDATDADEDDAR